MNADHAPTAYPYLRESHVYSAMSGISWQTQLDICRRYWEANLKGKGVVLGEPTHDEAISARKVPFLCRKEGFALDQKLQRGDHVIVAYHDRQHRTISDFCNLIDRWKPRGITMHFANLGVDLSTPHGMAVANMMFVMAQWQSDSMSERNKAVAAYLKSTGRSAGGRMPMGYVKRGPKGDRQCVPYPEERRLMRAVVVAKDSGMTWNEIAETMEAVCETLRQKWPRCPAYKAGVWSSYEHCRKAYRYYMRILERENGDVTSGLKVVTVEEDPQDPPSEEGTPRSDHAPP